MMTESFMGQAGSGGAVSSVELRGASCWSAHCTENIVCARGGFEKIQRRIRVMCFCPYQGTCVAHVCVAAVYFSAVNSVREGIRRVFAKASSSAADFDHSMPGNASMRILDQDTSVSSLRRVTRRNHLGHPGAVAATTAAGMQSPQ